ncbi:unnamed protein product [Adineta steineri]|uniref:Uncharacterized protein n=1 Tax=Adineta steineri TaxID=433720 RepID=A0A815RYR3_9BILA|nr:unnamed protein product [Adineta steineri]CAF1639130.1 unnamed protein product [Adineta steineri]
MTATRYTGDFRSQANLQFQVLRELCNRSKTVLSNNIESFYDTELISGYLMGENLLRVDTEAAIDTFKSGTYGDFQQSIQFIRAVMVGNVMVSGIETTGIILYYTQNGIPVLTYSVTNFRNAACCSCTCDTADTCSVMAGFYNDSLVDTFATVAYWPGSVDVSFVMNNWFVGVIEVRTSWWQRIQTIIQLLWRSLVELNMFKSSARQEPSDIKQQRWTTRIFVLCLVVAMVILMFYSILIVQTKSVKVNNPSLEIVLYLKSQSELNSSLQCPCTRINTPYGQLVQLQPSYHQVCSSVFVSYAWHRFLINSSVNTLLSELFIENWSQMLSYSSYFNQCQPASCSYKIAMHNSLLQTITTIFGLLGGVAVSLRILVPFVMTACFAFISRRGRQRVATEPSNSFPESTLDTGHSNSTLVTRNKCIRRSK